MPVTYKSKSEEDTAALAGRIVPLLRRGDLLCLHGNLGTGKSVFCRALIRKLCNAPALTVPSPTYTLVQGYDAPGAPVYHFDLYRLEEPEEIYELGWEDALYEGISLIEWPERLGGLVPAERLDIVLEGNEAAGKKERFIRLEPQGKDWEERLAVL